MYQAPVPNRASPGTSLGAGQVVKVQGGNKKLENAQRIKDLRISWNEKFYDKLIYCNSFIYRYSIKSIGIVDIFKWQGWEGSVAMVI